MENAFTLFISRNADAILGYRAGYAHGLNPVKRVAGHFLWEQGLTNEKTDKQTKK